MAYPTTPLAMRFRYALGADLTAAPSTYAWTDFTTDVDTTFDITDKIGSTDDASESNSSLVFTVRNPTGKYTIDNPESPLWPFWRIGTPIEYAIDSGDGAGFRVQVITYLGAADVQWTANTPFRCIAEITAAGVFRRLGQNPALASTLRRAIPSYKRRRGFWPFEDAAGARQAASADPSVPPLVGNPPEFGVASLVPGAASVAKFGLGHSLFTNLPSPTSSQGVRLTCLLHAETIPAGLGELFELRAQDGTVGRYVVEIGTGVLRFRAYSTAGAEVSGAGSIGFTAHQTDLIWFELDIVQTSAGTLTWTMRETTWRFTVDGLPSGTSGTSSSTFSGTLGGIIGVGVAPTAALVDIQVGMLALCEQPFPASGGFAAVLGWAGNTATDRIQGMANEFGVPSEVTATGLGSVMGPQIVGSLLANLRDVANTDHGVLTDHRGVVGYTALMELYNLAPALTLSVANRGEIGQLDPVHDDQEKVNIASASRPGGSTSTMMDLDDVVLSGRYEREPITVNVATDTALPGHAGWLLARGLNNGYKYKQLTLEPHLAPGTATIALGLLLGDRIAVSNLPPQMAKGGIERQIRGRTQVLRGGISRHANWKITYDLVPVDAYNAFILDSDRLDTAGTEVIVAATSAATGITTQFAPPKAAVTGSTSIPLWAAGERVTLTAVADEVLAEGWTGTPVAGGLGSMPASTHVAAQPWTCVVSTAPGTLADFNRTGTSATFTLQAASSILRAALLGLPMRHPEITTSFQFSVSPTGDGIFAALQYRRGAGGGTDAYEAHILVNPSGSPILTLYGPGAAVLAQVLLPITPGPAIVYNIRIAPVGPRHRVRAWSSVVAEPQFWQIDTVDTARLAPGPVGLRTGRLAGNTNVGTITTTCYNVSFSGVQHLTVTRGVNGFSKALAIGDRVKLWQGRGLGV